MCKVDGYLTGLITINPNRPEQKWIEIIRIPIDTNNKLGRVSKNIQVCKKTKDYS